MSSAIDPELSQWVRPRAILTDLRRVFSRLIGLTYDTAGVRAIESHLIPFATCSRLRFL